MAGHVDDLSMSSTGYALARVYAGRIATDQLAADATARRPGVSPTAQAMQLFCRERRSRTTIPSPPSVPWRPASASAGTSVATSR